VTRRTLLLLALAAPLLTATAATKPAGIRPRFDLTRAEIRDFMVQAAARTGFSREAIEALLAQAEPQASILEAISRPAEAVLPWWQYRERFLTARRIDTGLAFWAAHDALLARVAAERGVPAEYLVAILGVETSYGRITGRYRVLDALATLGFDFPARSAYFRGELEEFLLLVKEDSLDPLAVRGSYAGAIGVPQFMPSSIRRYAVDVAGKGRRDLWNDWDDVLASVANYLLAQGWKTGEPVMVEAGSPADRDDPLAFRLEIGDTLGGIRRRGYVVDSALPDATPALLVPAEQADSMSWRVGFTNFYVITRYNRSPRYAMAVHDLAQALRSRRDTPETSA
jgi:membrane-bound lytic murein transglycosylase B